MFLHVGNNKNIRVRDIIGIFDTDNATLSPVTKQYLSRIEKNGMLDLARQDVPKSFVLYRTEKGCRVCFSQLSATTLSDRLNDPSGL